MKFKAPLRPPAILTLKVRFKRKTRQNVKVNKFISDMAFHEKLVLRSTATMSLHERFTQLRKIVVQPIEETPSTRPPPPAPPPPPQYYVPPPERSEPRVDRARMAAQPRYRRENRISRQLAIEAALKLKRKSIKQRLGIRQNNFRRNQTQTFGWRGGRARRVRGRFRDGINGQWNNMRTQNGNIGRRRQGTWRRGGGGRGGRGGRRQRGRGGRQPQTKVTKEELDQQLDSYMANTKTVLDRDLDDYMSQKTAAEPSQS